MEKEKDKDIGGWLLIWVIWLISWLLILPYLQFLDKTFYFWDFSTKLSGLSLIFNVFQITIFILIIPCLFTIFLKKKSAVLLNKSLLIIWLINSLIAVNIFGLVLSISFLYYWSFSKRIENTFKVTKKREG